MSATKPIAAKKKIDWTPALIKMLRGKRTLAEFGELIGAPKNTVWRWEDGRVTPDAEYSNKLSKLADREHFLEDWQLVGSMEIVGDLEQGSKQIADSFKKSLARSATRLTA
jgi:DNA-binding XRE family transcriptional regulator